MTYGLEPGTHTVPELVDAYNAGPESFDPGTPLQDHLVCALVELSTLQGDDPAKFRGIQELVAAMRRVDARDGTRTEFDVKTGSIDIRRSPVGSE